jgi:hypothetical protein
MSEDPRDVVLLVHGMGRTPLSMLGLAARLRRAGAVPVHVGYVSAVESFDRIVARVAARVTASRPLLAVGHSLGGLLLRAALGQVPPQARPRRLVCAGTPHRAPRWARVLRSQPVYRLLTGDSGQLLADPVRMAAIPAPPVPTVCIAGDAGPRWRWTPLGDLPNDLVVAVDEVVVDGVPLEVLPVRHTLMMHRRDVAAVVLRELEAARQVAHAVEVPA